MTVYQSTRRHTHKLHGDHRQIRSSEVLPKSMKVKQMKMTYTKTDYGGGICVYRWKRSLGRSGNRWNATVKGRREVAKMMMMMMMMMVIIIIVIIISLNIQGVPGGMDKTSGECSLC